MIHKIIPYGESTEKRKFRIVILNTSFELNRITIQLCRKDGTLLEPMPVFLKARAQETYLLPVGVYSVWLTGAYSFAYAYGRGLDIKALNITAGPEEIPDSNVMTAIKNESLYHKFVGRCGFLPRKNLFCLMSILRQHWHETGAVTVIADMNAQKGHCSGHPIESHNGYDADFKYDDLAITWKLMKRILDVFPDAIIQIGAKTLPLLKLEMTGKETAQYSKRFIPDSNPDWHHEIDDKYAHFHVSGIGRKVAL